MGKENILMLMVVAPRDLESEYLRNLIDGFLELGGSVALFIPGERVRNNLLERYGRKITVEPWSRQWLVKANDIVSASDAGKVFVAHDASVDANAMFRCAKGHDGPVLLGWPPYSNSTVDHFRWRCLVPQPPSSCFLFSSESVKRAGGFNPSYPAVAHWEMILRLTAEGVIPDVATECFSASETKYVPGYDPAERRRFLLEGEIMLGDHGQKLVSPPLIIMTMQNILEQMDERFHPLKWTQGEDLKRGIECAVRWACEKGKYMPIFELNGVERSSRQQDTDEHSENDKANKREIDWIRLAHNPEIDKLVATYQDCKLEDAISLGNDIIRSRDSTDFAKCIAAFYAGNSSIKMRAPKDAGLFFKIGVRFAKRGKAIHAIPAFFNNIGVACYEQGNSKSAPIYFQAALQFKSDYMDALYNLKFMENNPGARIWLKITERLFRS